MFNKRSIGFALSMAAVMGASLGVQPAPAPSVVADRKSQKGFFGGAFQEPEPKRARYGEHVSMTQQQRNSRKAKNVKRHRAACRG